MPEKGWGECKAPGCFRTCPWNTQGNLHFRKCPPNTLEHENAPRPNPNPQLFSFLRVGPRPFAFGTFLMTPLGKLGWGWGVAGGGFPPRLTHRMTDCRTCPQITVLTTYVEPTISGYLRKRTISVVSVTISVASVTPEFVFVHFLKIKFTPLF
jgi:hypothetical protein